MLIVGGGLIGASLACALAQGSARVALIEASPLTCDAHPSYDDRAIAVSLGSRRILEGLGVWAELESRVEAIRHIHVSDRGRFGFTRLHAEDHGVAAFGFVTDARTLGFSIQHRLSEHSEIKVFCPARVESVTIEPEQVEVGVATEDDRVSLRTALLVAADGGHSRVRELLGIEAEQREYGQYAVTANVTPTRAHRGVAYERFTKSGPLALLPLTEARCGLIWSVEEARAARLMEMDEPAFLAALADCFGGRLGRFTQVGKRTVYPLSLIRASEQVRARLAVVGNAAHTLHPIAGQGVNLGFRDVAALAETLADALRAGIDPGIIRVLERYASWRRDDQLAVTRFTDVLVRLFSNRFAPLVIGRNFGLLALDLVPALKNALVQRAMGLAGRQPRLARGVPL